MSDNTDKKYSKIRIVGDHPNRFRVFVDDADISRYVGGVSFSWNPGTGTVIDLRVLPIAGMEIDVPAEVFAEMVDWRKESE